MKWYASITFNRNVHNLECLIILWQQKGKGEAVNEENEDNTVTGYPLEILSTCVYILLSKVLLAVVRVRTEESKYWPVPVAEAALTEGLATLISSL